MSEQLLGLLITVISGVLVYVICQWYTEFILRPIQEYKKLKAKTAKLLVLYACYYSNPLTTDDGGNTSVYAEASNNIRELAAEVAAYAEIKPLQIFVFPAMPNEKKMIEAYHNLIGLSNSFFTIPSDEGACIDHGIRSTSLTENGVQSMPMWAHYGSNHRGFCVSYDMSANGRLSACTFPVQYTNERFDITSLMKKHAEYISSEFERQSALGNRTIELNDFTPIYATTLLCNLKHSSWSYEKEFRCTLSSQAKGNPYVEAKPKEIYIGMNCSPLHTKRLMEIADSWNIPIKKMSFDECSTEYKLVDNRI